MTSRERKEAIARIRQDFPKHSPAAFSLAMRTDETGVQLCRRALELAGRSAPRRTEKRSCPERVTLRFTTQEREALNEAKRQLSIESDQQLLHGIVCRFLREMEKAAAPLARDDGTQKISIHIITGRTADCKGELP